MYTTHSTRPAGRNGMMRNQSQASAAARIPLAPQAPSANGLYRCSADGTIVPGCGSPVAPICDVQMVTGVTRGTAAGATGQLQMAPVRTNYFQALAERLEAVDSAAPNVFRQAEIVQIEVNRFPQEPFSDALAAGSPRAAFLDFFGRSFLEYGKPVSYGIYSQAALIQVFEYGFVNINATAIDLYGVHFGNSLDVLPPGMEAGKPFN